MDMFSFIYLFIFFSWDSQYESELANFKRHGDVGEVWFEESVDKLMEWILDSDRITTQSSVIDIGCGNGSFLLNLVSMNCIILSSCGCALDIALLLIIEIKFYSSQFA